ncbi:MAG: hypothetical protein HRU20_11335 [Pseudomonadales bacterium]|nr:hypothetical protein [Pseudomonadales bacterium]
MNEDQFLAEISKHFYAMQHAINPSSTFKASMLLTQSYIILYNAEPGPHCQLSLSQINDEYIVEEITHH